jgi:hypothetical protein
LQVSIETHNDFAPRVVKSRSHGSGLAKITPELHHTHAILMHMKASQYFIGAIGAAVIDKNHFPGMTHFFHCRFELTVEEPDIFHLIKQRNDNGYLRMGFDIGVMRYNVQWYITHFKAP